jgi:uncharacterized ferritin-like protein (DUF455 family)
MELRQRALEVLCIAQPREKAAQALALAEGLASISIADSAPAATLHLPGRPEKPQLIHPAKVPRRSPSKPEGLAALLHAIAHIEFNAIKVG